MAFDAFLIFDSTATGPNGQIRIVGESLDATYKGAIELKAFEVSSENPVTIGSTTGAGKLRFSPFKIMKSVDSTSPAFLSVIGNGTHFPTVSLYLRKAGTTNATFAIYRFSTVFVTSQDAAGSAGDDTPVENIQLVFGAMQIEYDSYNASGGLSGKNIASWSQVTNSNKFP